jgi:hypothetical protein
MLTWLDHYVRDAARHFKTDGPSRCSDERPNRSGSQDEQSETCLRNVAIP